MIEVITVIAPAAWASYLVNGDASSLSDAEVAQADRYVKGVRIVSTVDGAEPYFTSRFQLYGGIENAACGEVIEYVGHVITEDV
jgi:hypothetical protein